MNLFQQKGNVLFLTLTTMIVLSVLSIGLFKVVESRNQRFLLEILDERATNFTRSAMEQALNQLYHDKSSEVSCTSLAEKISKLKIENFIVNSPALNGFSSCKLSVLSCETKTLKTSSKSKYHRLIAQGVCTASCQPQDGHCVQSTKRINVVTKSTLLPGRDMHDPTSDS